MLRIICILLCAAFSQLTALKSNTASTVKLDFQELELAYTPIQWKTGLMCRDKLCRECGMLFVFYQETTLSFWMKNTYIPIDIIYISSQGEVIDIIRNAEPLNDQMRYVSSKPAQYVLETNVDYLKDIQAGDIIDLKSLIDGVSPFKDLYVENSECWAKVRQMQIKTLKFNSNTFSR